MNKFMKMRNKCAVDRAGELNYADQYLTST